MLTDVQPRRAFDQLVAARKGILRQYKHSDAPIPKTSSPVASENTNRLNPNWLECCWLPCPEEPKIPDQLRAVFVQQIASAWSCLIGIEGCGYDLPVCPPVKCDTSLICSPSRSSCSFPLRPMDGFTLSKLLASIRQECTASPCLH